MSDTEDHDAEPQHNAILTLPGGGVIEAIPAEELLAPHPEEEEEIHPAPLPPHEHDDITVDTDPRKRASSTSSQGTENSEDAWGWFNQLRSKIEQSNQGIKEKFEKSNKAIEENFKNTNKVIEEKFIEGWDAVSNAPVRAVDTIRKQREHMIEMKEEKQSEHWKHEKKLVMKYESLDYVRIYNKSYRKELYNKFFNVTGDYEWLRWILTFFMGIFIGLIAYIAHFGIQNIAETKFEVIIDYLMEINFGLAFVSYWLINVFLSILAALLAVYYEPTAAGSGIPEVKAYLNGTKIPGFFRMKTLIAKLFSMIFANGATLQVGAEGPMIHIGALIGNGVSQAQSKEFGFKIPWMKQFRNDRDKRDFITSGAGAGVAAAFGAPLGGTLFSLEEVASFWSTLLTWRTFFLSMVSVGAMKFFLTVLETGTLLDTGFMIYNVGTSLVSYRYLELIPFFFIGIIGGLLGALFTYINLKVTAFRGAKINKQKRYRVYEVIAIATVSSFLQFLAPFMFPCTEIAKVNSYRADALTQHYCPEGTFNDLASIMFTSNEHAIYNLFTVNDAGRLSFAAVFVFFVFYFLGMSYTAGCGISSGTFVPMIVVGASYGRMVGLIIRLIYGSVDPGIYAIMGAAAFMAGVSRLTVSLTVILIEITNDLANLLPIMLVVMTAKWTADFCIKPYFDELIEMKHIPYLEPNPSSEMKLLMCKHVMARKPKFFFEKEKIGKILLILKDTTHNGFPIVTSFNERRLKGLVLRSQLLVLLDRMSQIWVDRTDLEYSHQNYQTKLSWTLPKLEDLLERFELDDYNKEVDLGPYINITVVSVTTDFAVSEAYLIFRTMGLRHLPVVNDQNKLKGMITKKDLLEHNCAEIYRELKALKKIDFNADFPEEEDDTPMYSPRVRSPAVSRRGSPAVSRRTSPTSSRRTSVSVVKNSNLHVSSP